MLSPNPEDALDIPPFLRRNKTETPAMTEPNDETEQEKPADKPTEQKDLSSDGSDGVGDLNEIADAVASVPPTLLQGDS